MRDDFKLGKAIVEESSKEGQDDYVNLSSFDDEVQAMNVPNELKDLFCYLFETDPKRRPSAAQVLISSEFLALQSAAATSAMATQPDSTRISPNRYVEREAASCTNDISNHM